MSSLLVLSLLACGGAEQPPAEAPAPTERVDEAPAEAPAPALPSDVVPTATGDLRITPIGHGTLVLQHNGVTIWVDPWSQVPLEGPPKADVLLITDVHPDHLDRDAIAKVRDADTILVGPAAIADTVQPHVTLANGETRNVAGIPVTAVPMYNVERGPEEGGVFHEKGRGNGYVLSLADKRVYIAGDTECTPEMKALREIDVAFVPMNLPYTMTPEEAADCIEAFRPKIVYPYHYRGSDLSVLEQRLADDEDIELRVREWYRQP